MKLVVGLGNPGKQYEKTRHNIGFVVVDNFLKNQNLTLSTQNLKPKFHCLLLECEINDEKVFFCKPQTFINLSGEAIGPIAHFYKIKPADILVIHDEIDLPTGKIQLKLGGSSAGHNGLKSTIEKLGTKDFWRLRIGVDRPANQDDVADYVLSTFKPDEKELLAEQDAKIENFINEFLEK